MMYRKSGSSIVSPVAPQRGFEWESDPRHAELILQQLGLESASSLSSPGTKERDHNPDEEELQGEEATEQ
eukprot:7305973-Heterocapsa_arctica.AAC.1